MHVPDGFLDAPVSVAAGVVAAGAVALALRGARRELDGPAGPGPAGPGAVDGERLAPLAGLVAAFVFAAQMLNFPVGAGTSGHLMGGALAAILVGPWTGVLCLSVVLLLQALLFADGGLTALGVNVLIMGVVTVVTGHVVFRVLVTVLPRGRRTVTGSAFAAALVSVPVAALAFVLLYAVGGTTEVPLGEVTAAMVGVHVLIGIGEAAITALTVGAVLAVRPDLVRGARDAVRRPLRLRVQGRLVDAPAPVPTPSATGPKAVRWRLWAGGLAVSLVLAGFVSSYASGEPDGLERVAADRGMDAEEAEHAAAGSPLADYEFGDLTGTRLSGGLAGVIGVGITVAVGTGVVWASRRRSGRSGDLPDVRSGDRSGGDGATADGAGGVGEAGRADGGGGVGGPGPATGPGAS
ncbi:energy-coupling factor ABC transporter permease [Streptomyces sp. JNUCC 64]